MENSKKIHVPLDVPKAVEKTYLRNYDLITHGSGRLMLFAGDQRVEHLNDDFYGKGISLDDADPEHLFKIASQARIGVFATQLGSIARYGRDYKKIPYLVKLNSRSNLVKVFQKDPLSSAWYSVKEVADFAKRTGLSIPAVGYTIYLGSEFESEMLCEAARIIADAHAHGMISVIWVYPRGKAVINENYAHLVAGAVNVAAALGSDFVKVNYPRSIFGENPAELFKEAILAGGRTKVVCAGGESADVKIFLSTLHDQIFVSGASGNATGRNVHQKPLAEAIKFCNAISAITIDGLNVIDAMKIYKS